MKMTSESERARDIVLLSRLKQRLKTEDKDKAVDEIMKMSPELQAKLIAQAIKKASGR